MRKLDSIRANSKARDFVIADAKDADVTWGVAGPGAIWPPAADGSARFRTLPEFLEQIRQIVAQGVVDIVLASVSVMDHLAHQERIFDNSDVTPAIRANDTSDIWCARGARYRQSPSVPFSSVYLHEAQYGSLTAQSAGGPVVNLGLFSVTFNNNLESDRLHLEAFKAFRAEAQRCGFHYFLEIFPPNVDAGISVDQIPAFVNDWAARLLAGVPAAGRPVFLKVPYFGPKWMEELASYDPTVIVGIMGGTIGTTFDSFTMLAEAQKYGARVALYGRRIKEAEDPLSFILAMRQIVEAQTTPADAVRWYHAQLQKQKIPPKRSLADDMQLTPTQERYAINR